jgi:hypothetical protein
MHPDDPPTTPLLTRIGWFFWRNWNRAVCATRGHDGEPRRFCNRCGLPLPPFDGVEDIV